MNDELLRPPVPATTCKHVLSSDISISIILIDVSQTSLDGQQSLRLELRPKDGRLALQAGLEPLLRVRAYDRMQHLSSAVLL